MMRQRSLCLDNAVTTNLSISLSIYIYLLAHKHLFRTQTETAHGMNDLVNRLCVFVIFELVLVFQVGRKAQGRCGHGIFPRFAQLL